MEDHTTNESTTEGLAPQQHPSANYMERRRELHAKVMEITMTIHSQYPELSDFLEEMPETIPAEKDPEMALMDLKKYYESLVALLDKYKVEHPV